jgi:hypothetical protein
MGIQQGLVCKGEMCMWFNGSGCSPFGSTRHEPEQGEQPAEEKTKTGRTKRKDAAAAQ